jgi:hypothetical protein
MQLKVSDDYLPAFLACLGIGTLQAIREHVVLAEVGIWTLAPPKMWEPLLDKSNVPDEIINIFKQCDELYVFQEYIPDQFDSTVSNLIDRLKLILSNLDEQAWDIEWVTESDDISDRD